MILSVFWENPAVVGLILAIPTVVLAYLGYRRSIPRDKAAAQVGVNTGHIDLIAALQEDNKVLRNELKELRMGVELVQARLDVVESGNLDLVAKLREAEREIAVLHFENEALKVENEKLKMRISELEKGSESSGS